MTRSATAGQAAGPKLIASLPSITVPRHGKVVYLDPDIWLATLAAPFQIDAVRASYTRPVQAFEIVDGRRPGPGCTPACPHRASPPPPCAKWETAFGLSGQCGVPTANWVSEYMPIGWGDTYDQFKAGQAFNITHLPDGTYYIEIIANPEHLLHEVTAANDVSLRKAIITGPAGDRHVRVPAWHGIDAEK